MKHKFYFAVFVIYILGVSTAFAQEVTRSSASSISGATCPGIGIQYQVSVPSGFGVCNIAWSATNGQVNSQSGATAYIQWDDTPGAMGTVTATFSNCGDANKGNNGKTASLSELILSVKGQNFDAYTSSITIDYCTTKSITLTVPHMYVQGTGGIAQPPAQEVVYSWTLPPGWTTDGSLNTYLNGITIRPIGCAVPGTVQVNGVINDRCGAAGASNSATITLNGAQPFVTLGIPQGYAGSMFGISTPVTFTANLSPSLGCVSSYSWAYPSGWTPVSQSGNTITLRPSGSPSDAGAINVSANFSCGTFIKSGNYNVPYTPPTISGPVIICSTGQFAIQNAPGASAIWSSSNSSGLSFDVPSNSTATRKNNFSGLVTVTASLTGANGTSTATLTTGNISVGAPSPLSIEVILVDPSFGRIQVAIDPIPGATSYNWYVNNVLNTTYHGTFAQLPISKTRCDLYYDISVSASTPCGTSSQKHSNVYVPCPFGASMTLTAFPNPASSTLTVQIKDNRSADAESNSLDHPYQLHIMDRYSRKVFSVESNEKSMEIPVDNLPSDIYYLNIFYKGEILKEQILIMK